MIDKDSLDYIFICKKCNIGKPNSEYTKRNTGKRQRHYFSKCKKCQNENVIRWSRDSIKSKKYKLKKYFNIEYEDYLTMLKKQNNSCMICKVNQKDLNRKLCVDHCHITGEVRGLLCNSCNRALGYFKDNINNLQEAVNYLKQSKVNASLKIKN